MRYGHSPPPVKITKHMVQYTSEPATASLLDQPRPVELAGGAALITDTDVHGDRRVIRAQVPLASMFGYATVIRSLTQGRAGWSMEASHYRQAPDEVAKALLEVG